MVDFLNRELLAEKADGLGSSKIIFIGPQIIICQSVIDTPKHIILKVLHCCDAVSAKLEGLYSHYRFKRHKNWCNPVGHTIEHPKKSLTMNQKALARHEALGEGYKCRVISKRSKSPSSLTFNQSLLLLMLLVVTMPSNVNRTQVSDLDPA